MNAKVLFDDGTELVGTLVSAKVEELYIKTPSGTIPKCKVTATVKIDIGTIYWKATDKFKIERRIK